MCKLHSRELYPAVGFNQVPPAEFGVAVEASSSTGNDLTVVETSGNVPKSHREGCQLKFRDYRSDMAKVQPAGHMQPPNFVCGP